MASNYEKLFGTPEMAAMTATDELRRMLDERGVEWSTNETLTDCWTRWNAGKFRCTAIEINGTFAFTVGNSTPEQAIAATLGRGTCHATSNPPVPKHWTGCSNCGSVWDFFYNICGYMGPPNFCPKCGAKVVDA